MLLTIIRIKDVLKVPPQLQFLPSHVLCLAIPLKVVLQL